MNIGVLAHSCFVIRWHRTTFWPPIAGAAGRYPKPNTESATCISDYGLHEGEEN
jgi:hypothetical protein